VIVFTAGNDPDIGLFRRKAAGAAKLWRLLPQETMIKLHY
jgi:hypothetical protein